MRFVTALSLSVVCLLACKSPTTTTIPPAAPEEPCGEQAREAFEASVIEARPDQRLDLLTAFASECGHEHPFFRTLSEFASPVVVEVPEAAPREARRDFVVSISLTHVIFGDQSIEMSQPEWSGRLSDLMVKARGEDPQSPGLVIRADKDVPYKTIVGIMDLARSAGIVHISFAVKTD